jgi:aminopeptidase-like protein
MPMTQAVCKDNPSVTGAGDAMCRLVRELYPICRSITGPGVRETLRRLERLVPLEIREVPTGTKVFDWTVPQEWSIRDAYVKDSRGRRVVDFRESNLHVVSYSVPISRRMTLQELKPHLHSLPEHPDWIPYRTSYYSRDWGFCLAHRRLLELADGEYEVSIDATLKDGSLTFGELYLPGDSEDEVLFSCHVCHPSLANDNLSAVAVAAFLARELGQRRRYSYRFLFAPGTIGAITWLALNEQKVGRIKHGLVLALLGGPGGMTYKRSRRGDAAIDRVVPRVLGEGGRPHAVVDFDPYGYDERQFCSPGFNLPVGRLTRAPHGRYPEYHTSADNMELVRPDRLEESLAACRRIVDVLEHERFYVSCNPKCEPQLGRRGLLRNTGGKGPEGIETACLWILSLADGGHSLVDISERSGLPPATIRQAALRLEEHGLIRASSIEAERTPGCER